MLYSSRACFLETVISTNRSLLWFRLFDVVFNLLMMQALKAERAKWLPPAISLKVEQNATESADGASTNS